MNCNALGHIPMSNHGAENMTVTRADFHTIYVCGSGIWKKEREERWEGRGRVAIESRRKGNEINESDGCFRYYILRDKK